LDCGGWTPLSIPPTSFPHEDKCENKDCDHNHQTNKDDFHQLPNLGELPDQNKNSFRRTLHQGFAALSGQTHSRPSQMGFTRRTHPAGKRRGAAMKDERSALPFRSHFSHRSF